MRSIPPALQAKLSSGVTTLARCWIVTRRDGVVMGFTDHDVDLTVAGTLCRAGTGLTASEATARLGLQVDGSEIAGALADDSLAEADLAAGRYDAAHIETWLVDWSEPSLKLLTARGTLGEVKREANAFTAELRGPADALSQESGRLYTVRCGADLGDSRCRIDLTSPAFRGSGAVVAVDGTSDFVASGLGGFADGWFSAGRLSWTAGANAGLAIEIKLHRVTDGAVRLTLWQAMAETIVAGDTFMVTAGCDKRFATCRDRFANTDNVRGFPHIPGNDFLIATPAQGAPGNDGLSLSPPFLPG